MALEVRALEVRALEPQLICIEACTSGSLMITKSPEQRRCKVGAITKLVQSRMECKNASNYLIVDTSDMCEAPLGKSSAATLQNDRQALSSRVTGSILFNTEQQQKEQQQLESYQPGLMSCEHISPCVLNMSAAFACLPGFRNRPKTMLCKASFSKVCGVITLLPKCMERTPSQAKAQDSSRLPVAPIKRRKLAKTGDKLAGNCSESPAG